MDSKIYQYLRGIRYDPAEGSDYFYLKGKNGELYYDHLWSVKTRRKCAYEDSKYLEQLDIPHKVFYISDTDDYVLVILGIGSKLENYENLLGQECVHKFIPNETSYEKDPLTI